MAAAVVLAGVGGATADPAPSASDLASSSPAASSGTTATDGPATPPPTASATTPPTPTTTLTPTATATATATPTARPAPGTALAALAALPVKGRAPRTGYDRALFGPAWTDVDRNGCDTRNDVLRRDLRALTLKAGTHGCVVLTGTLTSPYTGQKRSFVRGQGTSSAVQIDHVVALSDAWQKGAQQLGGTVRTAFANDPLNLLAVEGSVNQSKGDGDAATWLPPLKASRCAYVARQVAVKRKYHLWVTAAERDAIRRILLTCPAQPLPTARAVPLGGGRVVTGTPTPTTRPRTTTPPATTTDPRFPTCKAAKAAGYGPYRRGVDPEYGWYRDADSDGIVCE
ncbi:MAG: DUF1524 domain-containing protein [Micrococcales bacterium]|nr:DUF1524 domain-containing protein [Micrococcales bacterium]